MARGGGAPSASLVLLGDLPVQAVPIPSRHCLHGSGDEGLRFEVRIAKEERHPSQLLTRTSNLTSNFNPSVPSTTPAPRNVPMIRSRRRRLERHSLSADRAHPGAGRGGED